jgi:hypothetical protein
LHPWNASKVTPKLWLNPWADYPLEEGWPFPSATATQAGEITHEEREPQMYSLLGVPADWPRGRPFPRG